MPTLFEANDLRVFNARSHFLRKNKRADSVTGRVETPRRFPSMVRLRRPFRVDGAGRSWNMGPSSR